MNNFWGGFIVGLLIGAMFSMSVNEFRGERIESGTKVYPTEQECILKTRELCKFNSVGIYTPIKDI